MANIRYERIVHLLFLCRMALNRFMTDIPKADVNEALLLFLDIVISSFDSPLTNVSVSAVP